MGFRPSATESHWRELSRGMKCWGPRVEEARYIFRLLERSSEIKWRLGSRRKQWRWRWVPGFGHREQEAGKMDKEDGVRVYNGIVLSHKKERNSAICRDVDGPRDCHTE